MSECFYCETESNDQCELCLKAKRFPFEVRKNDELGRYMVATRDIKPFETILEDEALAYGPSEFNPVCCLICLQAVEKISKVCPHCNLPFCDSEVSFDNQLTIFRVAWLCCARPSTAATPLVRSGATVLLFYIFS